MDFVINGQAAEASIKEFVTWLVRSFESLRAVIHRCNSNLLIAILPEISFSLRLHAVKRISDALELKGVDILAARRSIDLLTENTISVVAYHVSVPGKTLVRILCSHLAMDVVTYRLMRTAVMEWEVGRRHLPDPRATYGDWHVDHLQYVESNLSRNEMESWGSWSLAPFSKVQTMMKQNCGSNTAECSIHIPPLIAAELKKKCQSSLMCRVPDALSAAIVNGLAENFGLSWVPITWTTHGRGPVAGRSYHSVPGWLSSLHPICVRADADPSTGVAEFLGSLNKCPNRGSTFAWVERFATDTNWQGVVRSLQTPFRVNVRESIHRDPNAVINGSTSELRLAYVSPVPCEKGVLRIYIVVDIAATITVSIKSTCDVGDQACRKLTACISAQIAKFAALRIA